MVVDCPLAITSNVKPFSRSDKTKEEEQLAQPVFCIVDTRSCYIVSSIVLLSILFFHIVSYCFFTSI